MKFGLSIAYFAMAVMLSLVAGNLTFADDGGPAAAKSMSGAMEMCGDCHDDYVSNLQLGPHSALDKEGRKLPEGATSACTACHGDASTHLAEGGGEGTIFSFKGVPAGDITDRCATCHGTTHPRFSSTPHAQAGLS